MNVERLSPVRLLARRGPKPVRAFGGALAAAHARVLHAGSVTTLERDRVAYRLATLERATPGLGPAARQFRDLSAQFTARRPGVSWVTFQLITGLRRYPPLTKDLIDQLTATCTQVTLTPERGQAIITLADLLGQDLLPAGELPT